PRDTGYTSDSSRRRYAATSRAKYRPSSRADAATYGATAHETDHVAAATGAKIRTESPRTTAKRASTSSDPRRKTFQPAWRAAAARASASASGGTRAESLGRGEERAAEAAPELVPAADPLACLGQQPPGVGWRIAVVADPAAELRLRHLRVELHAPARSAEPERLQRRRAVREGGRAVRQVVRVVVPDEPFEPRGERREHGIRAAGLRQLDLAPA